jgi:hypothetical protein
MVFVQQARGGSQSGNSATEQAAFRQLCLVGPMQPVAIKIRMFARAMPLSSRMGRGGIISLGAPRHTQIRMHDAGPGEQVKVGELGWRTSSSSAAGSGRGH